MNPGSRWNAIYNKLRNYRYDHWLITDDSVTKDGRTDGHGQTYIPPPSAGDKKYALKFLTFFSIKQPKGVLPRPTAYFRSIFSNVSSFILHDRIL